MGRRPRRRGVAGKPALVAGRARESITQPRWSPAGLLHYVSDRSGWWNLYDETGAGLCPLDAEFGGPDWVFGAATYAFLPDGRLVAAWTDQGRQQLGYIAGGRAEPRDLPFSFYSELQPAQGGVIALAASATTPLALVRLDLLGAVVVVQQSREVRIDPGAISTPDAVAFPTGGGEVAHAFVYPPRNPAFRGPDRGAAPARRDHSWRTDGEHGAGVRSVRPVLDHPGLRRG